LAFTQLIKSLHSSVELSKCPYIDGLARTEALNLPSHESSVLHGNLFILIRNIDAGIGLVNSCQYFPSATRPQTAVVKLDHSSEITLTRIPLEKTSNEMKSKRSPLPLPLDFAGIVYRFQDMNLDHAVVDCRSELWDPDGSTYREVRQFICPVFSANLEGSLEFFLVSVVLPFVLDHSL
jgi:hypothetical protein